MTHHERKRELRQSPDLAPFPFPFLCKLALEHGEPASFEWLEPKNLHEVDGLFIAGPDDSP